MILCINWMCLSLCIFYLLYLPTPLLLMVTV
uniref:Uncharacterized protein n=1 Tax=Rhizophora mucronata TaxID=61149 RepID=A0A2P2IUH2_RHIMU